MRAAAKTTAACAVVLAMAAGGCTSAPPPRPAEPLQSVEQSAEPANPPKPAGTDVTDDCADRMHDLCGVFLQYYLLHRDIPATYDDLAKAAAPIPLVCPASGKKYIYIPPGFVAPGSANRLLLLDPLPSHPGPEHRTRWGIVVKPPEGKQPIDAFVIPLSEEVLNQFQPVPQATQPH